MCKLYILSKLSVNPNIVLFSPSKLLDYLTCKTQ